MKRLIRSIFLAAFVITIIAPSFKEVKCEHVFTTVVAPEIKVEHITLIGGVYQPSYGKKDGADLICVKCFHKQKQIIDYGTGKEPMGDNWLMPSISPFLINSTIIIDTTLK